MDAVSVPAGLRGLRDTVAMVLDLVATSQARLVISNLESSFLDATDGSLKSGCQIDVFGWPT